MEPHMTNINGDQLSFVTTATQLRGILGDVSERVRTKVRKELSEMDRLWLAASPFCLVATCDAGGSCDVSPKGDPPGFTLVLDEKTIVIPERPGNRRADGFHNILQNGNVGLIFLVPGRGDTLRINGRAKLVQDAPFFDQLVVRGHRPSLAVLVEIDEVFFHCSKAFLRSDLWTVESWRAESVPSRPQIAKALENTGASLEELEIYYGVQYKKSLYGEQG
jgi:PPOX class probable FMN-dependent enzyme